MAEGAWRQGIGATGVAAALVLGGVACGDDGDGQDGGPTASGSATEAAGATAEITIADFAFTVPGPIEPGTTVTVRNDDSTRHTWTSVDGVFDSGILEPSDTFTFTFDEPGEFPFLCELHPSMQSTVTVSG